MGITIKVSATVALGEFFEDMLGAADNSAYQAKAEDRNRYVLD